MSQTSFKLDVHPLSEIEFIGTVKCDEFGAKEDTTLIETVVILDRSGSMGPEVARITNKIIPMVLSKLSYSSKQKVHLITFDECAEAFNISSDQMKGLKIESRGGTLLAPGVVKCQQLFETLGNEKPIRLLTISDGAVGDIKNTQSNSTILAKFIENNLYTVNSQAVRLFTSSSQPDTTALASLLQINNVKTSDLADISATETDESLAQKIANLFRNDGLGYGRILTTNEKVIKKFPWEPVATNQFTLTPNDNNLFWLTEVPDSANVQGAPVEVAKQQQLTLPEFQELLKETINNVNHQMKVLKVVGTDTAENTVSHMLEYFKKTEKELMKASDGEAGLDKISQSLAATATDDKIKNLTSAEKAIYLQKNDSGCDTEYEKRLKICQEAKKLHVEEANGQVGLDTAEDKIKKFFSAEKANCLKNYNSFSDAEYEKRLKICKEAKKLHDEEEEAKKKQMIKEEAKKKAEEEAETLQLIEEAKKIAEEETKKLQRLLEEAQKEEEEDNEAKKHPRSKEAKEIFSEFLRNTKNSLKTHLNNETAKQKTETTKRRNYLFLLVPIVAAIIFRATYHH